MAETYAVADLSPASRSRWQDLISAVYSPLDIDIGEPAAFTASASLSAFGPLHIARVASSGEFAQRQRRHIARDPCEAAVAVLVRRGAITLSQRGRSADLVPGDLSLLDLASPYSVRHAAPAQSVFLKIPTHLLRLRLPHLSACYASVPRAPGGARRIGADLMASFSDNCESVDPRDADRLSEDMIDILALAFAADGGAVPAGNVLVRGAIRQRATRFIARNLADPDLGPAAVAQALKISLRYLHRAFADGDSVGETIRKQRLQRCHDALAAPGGERLRIHQLAEQHGFRNLSHFSASFRDAFGCAPRDVRRRGGN